MVTDGRDARWVAHRIARRRELVEHAIRAIRRHGPKVGMAEIAIQAGTSKTVIYRHFGGRAGLYAAIGEAVHARILADLTLALEHSDPADIGRLTGDLAAAYLALVERDPSLYRFLMSPPLEAPTTDPAGRVPTVLADRLEAVLGTRLAASGQDPALAATWAYGLVGLVRAVADHWMATEPRPPANVVAARVASLFAPSATAGLAASSTEEYR